MPKSECECKIRWFVRGFQYKSKMCQLHGPIFYPRLNSRLEYAFLMYIQTDIFLKFTHSSWICVHIACSKIVQKWSVAITINFKHHFTHISSMFWTPCVIWLTKKHQKILISSIWTPPAEKWTRLVTSKMHKYSRCFSIKNANVCFCVVTTYFVDFLDPNWSKSTPN